jgi:hypothetical protein
MPSKSVLNSRKIGKGSSPVQRDKRISGLRQKLHFKNQRPLKAHVIPLKKKKKKKEREKTLVNVIVK